MSSFPSAVNNLRPQEPIAGPLDNRLKAVQLSSLLQAKNFNAEAQPLQLEAARQENAQRATAMAQTQALNKSYANAIKMSEDGTPQIDTGALTKSLAASNAGAAIPGAIESVTKYNKTLVDLRTAQTDLQSKSNDLLGHAASAIQKAGYDPQLAHTLLDTLPQNPQLNAFRAKIDDPAQLKQLVDSAIANSPKEREIAAQEQTAKAKTDTAANTATRLQAELPGGQLEDPNKAALQSFLQNPPKGYKPTPLEYERYKSSLAPTANFNLQMQAGGGLSKEALDQQAENYYNTGKLPPGGRGAAGIAQNRAIMNRAAELHAGQSLAEGSAEYAANKESLKKLQTNFDNVSAFESTAIKNLDQVAQAGQKIPDLGARFANVPVRMISEKMIGTPEMARFKTALLTAQTEAAKVLSSANASGVLSDSARHETQEILDGNLSFPSMMASINQLKTDFGNRHQSYADQIADIKGRIGGKAAPTQAPATAKPSSGLKAGDSVTIKGKTMKVTAVHPDGSFDAQ